MRVGSMRLQMRKRADKDLKTTKMLAGALTGWTRSDLGRRVVDQTGLTNRYTLSLHWTPDNAPASAALDTGGP